MDAMKTDSERGVIGAWARRARIAAGYSSAERAVAAANAAGIHLSLVYLRGIEAGAHKPGRGLVRELADFYGTAPPEGTVSEEWLDAVRGAVAAGVEEGIRRALDRLGAGSPPPPRRLPPRGEERGRLVPVSGGVRIEVDDE